MNSLRDDIKYRVVSYLREYHQQDFGPDPSIAVLRKTNERAEEITERVMRDVGDHLDAVLGGRGTRLSDAEVARLAEERGLVMFT